MYPMANVQCLQFKTLFMVNPRAGCMSALLKRRPCLCATFWYENIESKFEYCSKTGGGSAASFQVVLI